MAGNIIACPYAEVLAPPAGAAAADAATQRLKAGPAPDRLADDPPEQERTIVLAWGSLREVTRPTLNRRSESARLYECYIFTLKVSHAPIWVSVLIIIDPPAWCAGRRPSTRAAAPPCAPCAAPPSSCWSAPRWTTPPWWGCCNLKPVLKVPGCSA